MTGDSRREILGTGPGKAGRVLITGGSGLIGRALAADLARDGQEVVVLSRRPEQVTGLPKGARAEKWDGNTDAGWRVLADSAAAIVNLAGENISAGRWTKARKRAMLRSRLNAGQAVFRAVEAAVHRPKVVIQASGIGYYGPCGDETVTEETPPGDDFLARLAVEWEASTAKVETLGVRQAVIRTGVVLSNEGGALPRMLLPFRFLIGGRLGNGRQWFPWIHIEDEVRAIRFLLENETASGPFNLVAPSPINNGGFSKLLGEALKRPAYLPAPAFALRLLFGEMATALLDGQRAVPQQLLRSGFEFRFPEAGAALRDLLGTR